jgi:TolA-binding protein
MSFLDKYSSQILDIKRILEDYSFDYFDETMVLDSSESGIQVLNEMESELTQLQNEVERLQQRNDAQRILIQTLYQDLDHKNIDDAVKSGMVAILEGLIEQLKSGGN